MAELVLDLHGARAREGVDIDAFETFLTHFRAALREFDRAGQGKIPRKSGRPAARDDAATAFRMVAFRTGSGIATLAPSLARSEEDELALDAGEPLAVTTLVRMLDDIDAGRRLPRPVVEALSSARRAIGDDGSFGVALNGDHRNRPRLVIDRERIEHMSETTTPGDGVPLSVTGRLHMIEADPPNRRVQVRGQDGTDWTGTYPDHLHELVLGSIECIVRVSGTGRRLTPATGRLQIDEIDPIPEHPQDALFSVEPISAAQLRKDQRIDRPQGLTPLSDRWPDDDDEALLFLETIFGE